jgi:hypothetical protein
VRMLRVSPARDAIEHLVLVRPHGIESVLPIVDDEREDHWAVAGGEHVAGDRAGSFDVSVFCEDAALHPGCELAHRYRAFDAGAWQ